jgi:hypothetical protein
MLDGQSTNAEAARAQQATIVTTEAYQHTPLRDIQAACISRNSFNGLFDSLFVFQKLSTALAEKRSSSLFQSCDITDESDEPEVRHPEIFTMFLT